MFDSWASKTAFGAFAVSGAHCGDAFEQVDLEAAKQMALRNCGDDACYLVYQIIPEVFTKLFSNHGKHRP
jgi:hypothetical protein